MACGFVADLCEPVELLSLDEFVHIDFRLDNAGIFARLHAICRNHREMEGLSRFGFIPERFDFPAQRKVICAVDFKRPFREFDFAKIDNPVAAINYNVDLGAFPIAAAYPRRNIREDAEGGAPYGNTCLF